MKNKKGFVIIELVIVIAIIAILAAALIPTFGGLFDSANMTADQTLVRNMNTILLAESISEKPENIGQVITMFKENGISGYLPSYAKHVFYWDNEKNIIVIWDTDKGKFTYPNDYSETAVDSSRHITFSTTVGDVASFLDAISNANNGSLINITKPITVTGTTDGDMTNTGKTIILDFNGNAATGSNGNIAFRVRGNSIGTLQNGTIIADSNTWSAISAAGNDSGKAVANISNMTLFNTRENGNCVRGFDNSEINIWDTTIYSSIGGCVEMANGILTIHSGTFTQTGKTTSEYDANSMNVAVNSGGTAKIYGGTYTSETYGLYVMNSGGTMNVYGGTFKAEKAVLIANVKDADAVADCVFNIYGGSFDGKIWMGAGAVLNIVEGTFTNTTLTLEQFKAYVAEGSTVTEADGVYTVTKNS